MEVNNICKRTSKLPQQKSVTGSDETWTAQPEPEQSREMTPLKYSILTPKQLCPKDPDKVDFTWKE